MDAEQALTPPLWAPFKFLTDWEHLKNEGPLVWGLLVLIFVSTVAFLVLTFRKKPRAFFSPAFYLAMLPFELSALIFFAKFYCVILELCDGAVPKLIALPYAFQFGMVLSAILVSIHGLAFLIAKKSPLENPA